jgi:hypothetical protein
MPESARMRVMIPVAAMSVMVPAAMMTAPMVMSAPVMTSAMVATTVMMTTAMMAAMRSRVGGQRKKKSSPQSGYQGQASQHVFHSCFGFYRGILAQRLADTTRPPI